MIGFVVRDRETVCEAVSWWSNLDPDTASIMENSINDEHWATFHALYFWLDGKGPYPHDGDMAIAELEDASLI